MSSTKTQERDYDDALFYVQSIGGEVEIGNMEDNGYVDVDNCGSDNDVGDEDLYGDLDAIVFSTTKKAKTEKVSREVLESRLTKAVQEITELKDRITKLSKENLNLLTNFSSLLRTAREDKEKNIFTLRELRNQLRHVTTLNVQRSSLSKEEIEKIFNYCNNVEGQLQSQISLQVIRQALEAAKKEHLETKKSAYQRKWSKQVKFDNMSIYFSREQIPFSRLEKVTFPSKSAPDSKKVEKGAESEIPHVAIPAEKSSKTEESLCRKDRENNSCKNSVSTIPATTASSSEHSNHTNEMKSERQGTDNDIPKHHSNRSNKLSQESKCSAVESHPPARKSQKSKTSSFGSENDNNVSKVRHSTRKEHQRKKSRSPTPDRTYHKSTSTKRSRAASPAVKSHASKSYRNGTSGSRRRRM